jgi:threonine aldolase
VDRLCEKVDTVMFCLSKGLGAPVGSVLVGSEEDLAHGRLYRKRLGGGMRQAGVLAAPGLIALEEMSKRLGEDHSNAKLLAEGLARIPGIAIDPARVQTNILIFDVTGTGLTSFDLSHRLKARDVLANGINAATMRMVTHYDVSRADCERAIEVLGEVVAASHA